MPEGTAREQPWRGKYGGETDAIPVASGRQDRAAEGTGVVESGWCLRDLFSDRPPSFPEPSSPGEWDPRCPPPTPAELAKVTTVRRAWHTVPGRLCT